MKTREVAIVPCDSTQKTYNVRVRERGWLGFWSDWRELRTGTRQSSWAYDVAREYADQALANGWVPGAYSAEALPIIELDAERPA